MEHLINITTLCYMTLQHWREIKAVTIFGNSFMYTVATELPYNKPLECKFFNFFNSLKKEWGSLSLL